VKAGPKNEDLIAGHADSGSGGLQLSSAAQLEAGLRVHEARLRGKSNLASLAIVRVPRDLRMNGPNCEHLTDRTSWRLIGFMKS
jgi:hypothetical protein